MEVSLRRELGAHLRAARRLVTPQDVGLSGGGRRRVPGLRREEVAALAGVSVAWYTWLEQGRVTTSRQVIDAICRVLSMEPAAHQHALSLAGFLPSAPLADRGRLAVRAETRELVDAWTATPALVLDERFDILASNAAYRRFWGDPDDDSAERRNLLIQLASATRGRPRVLEEGPLLRGLYGQFRASTGHVPEDPRAAEIVRVLTQERSDIVHWWECRAVADFTPTTVEVTRGDGSSARPRITFALLRPVSEPGVYVLTQTPADPDSRDLLTLTCRSGPLSRSRPR